MGLSVNADRALEQFRSGGNIASPSPGILFSLMKREWPLNVSPACLSVLSCTMG